VPDRYRTPRPPRGNAPTRIACVMTRRRLWRRHLPWASHAKDPAHYEALISQEWKQIKKVSSTAKAYFEEIAKETTEYCFADQLREAWASVTEVSLVGAKVQRLVSAHGAG
jgi:hypothetical protein